MVFKSSSIPNFKQFTFTAAIIVDRLYYLDDYYKYIISTSYCTLYYEDIRPSFVRVFVVVVVVVVELYIIIIITFFFWSIFAKLNVIIIHLKLIPVRNNDHFK